MLFRIKLDTEYIFPGLARNYSQISALDCLESVSNKKRLVPRKKKATRKKTFNL